MDIAHLAVTRQVDCEEGEKRALTVTETSYFNHELRTGARRDVKVAQEKEHARVEVALNAVGLQRDHSKSCSSDREPNPRASCLR